MEAKKSISELEIEIADIRYQLMLKGTELDFVKQNLIKDSFERITNLTTLVAQLRKELFQLNEEISKLKFTYYITYEVRFKNIWTQQMEKEIYNETFLLNMDLQIDLPSNNNWNLDNEKVLDLLVDLMSLLKHKYDEVTLIRIKRI